MATRLDSVDFPADHYNYTNALRKELTILFGKAQHSREAFDAVYACLAFYGTKLQSLEGELDEYLKLQAERAKSEHEANVAKEAPAKAQEPTPSAQAPEPVAPAAKPAKVVLKP